MGVEVRVSKPDASPDEPKQGHLRPREEGRPGISRRGGSQPSSQATLGQHLAGLQGMGRKWA